MYPHFIKVHNLESEEPLLINIDNIVCVHPNWDYKDNSVIECVSREFYVIEESNDFVEDLIINAGCCINKGDPRLDDRPLTKEKIMEMDIGEPVWESNKRRWYQIANWNNQNDFYVTLQSVWDIVRFSENDLIKFPLYRMITNEDQ